MSKHAMSRFLCWLFLGGGAAVFPAQGQSVAPDASSELVVSAAATIAEYRMLCERDHGRLWDHDLCGPVMLVERDTRTLFADRDVPGQGLQRQHGVFVGRLPEQIGIANTATDYNDRPKAEQKMKKVTAETFGVDYPEPKKF